MAKEYVCDNCGNVFYERDWMWPVDERRDYCSEECMEEGRTKGQIVFCESCQSDVSTPHANCPQKYLAELRKQREGK